MTRIVRGSTPAILSDIFLSWRCNCLQRFEDRSLLEKPLAGGGKERELALLSEAIQGSLWVDGVSTAVVCS